MKASKEKVALLYFSAGLKNGIIFTESQTERTDFHQ